MVSSAFSLHRFEEFGQLTASERSALLGIAGPLHAVRRHARLWVEGDQPTGFYLLASGWVAAAHTLPAGNRQILKVHLPGDALGTPSMCMCQTVEELVALTDVTVMHIPYAKFGNLFETHPRIAARFMLSIQSERVALMDRLASIGRTSAQQRLAAFILDLMERLEPLGLVTDGTFFMALTQEQLGDIVGLTPVHTNRSLASLVKFGLLSRFGSQYTVPDPSALAKFAARSPRSRRIDPEWLPEPR